MPQPQPQPTDNPQAAQAEVVRQIDDLIREGNQQREEAAEGGLSFCDIWERNGLRYLGEHWTDYRRTTLAEGAGWPASSDSSSDTSTLQRLTINRTQNAIISGVAVQFERPPAIRIKPRESQDEPRFWIMPRAVKRLWSFANGRLPEDQPWFLTPDLDLMQQFGQAAAGNGMAPMGWSRHQLVGMAPITEQQVNEVVSVFPDCRWFALTPEMLASTEPLAENEAELLLLNGVLVEEELFREDDKAVAQIAQQAFDAIAERSDLEFHTVRNGLNCAIFGHQPMLVEWDSDEIKFKISNPNILNVWIDPNASTTKDAEYVALEYLLPVDRAVKAWPQHEAAIRTAASGGQSVDGQYTMGRDFDLDYQRLMVRVRTAWIRGEVYPMRMDEALRSGKVVEQPDANGGVTLVLAKTEERTAENIANWPTVTHIRQVQIIPDATLVVFDGRCPYINMPMGWNVNIPIPYMPFGIGEPQRLEDIQQIINRLISILHNHSRYYQFPMLVWPKSLVDEMVAKDINPYSKPGRMIPVDDGLWQAMIAGSNSTFGSLAPPPIPGDFITLLQMLLDEHDRLSGNVSVNRGEPETKDMSGVAIAQLQQAARGPLGFKAKHAQWCLEHVGKVMLDAMVTWMEVEDWARIINQVPKPILEHIRKRIMSSEFDVVVEVVAGKGLAREAEGLRARELHQIGLLSKTTAMERNDVGNVEDEKKRQREDMQEDAAAMAVPQAPGQQPQQQQPQQAA